MIESLLLAALAGLGVSLLLMLLVWLASLRWHDASLVDRFWGFGFVLVAAFWWWSGPQPEGAWLGLVLVALWGLRLSLWLTWRNWGHGEDARYRAMRDYHGKAFAWRSLLTVFALQGGILWLVALPLLVVSRGLDAGLLFSPLALAGLILFATGLVFEVVGDWQLARFKADPANRGRVMERGLWRYSRHPNYFGEILVWWGFFGLAAAAGGWWTLISPVLMSFLLARVSGVTLLEQHLQHSRPGYEDYVRRTSALIPWPPRRCSED